MDLFDFVEYGDSISYRTDEIVSLTSSTSSGTVVAVFKDATGKNSQIIFQTGKDQFQQISKFDPGYVVSRVHSTQKFRYDFRNSLSTEVKLSEEGVEYEHTCAKNWISRLFEFDEKGISTPVKLSLMRDRIITLARSSLYDSVWVDYADFGIIRNSQTEEERLLSSDDKIVLLTSSGAKVDVFSFRNNDASCYRKIFLSDYRTLEEAEKDRIKNPGRVIPYSDVSTKLAVERLVTDRLSELEEKSIDEKPAIQIVAGEGLTPSADAISILKPVDGSVSFIPSSTISIRGKTTPASTVTLSGTFTVPSGTSSEPTFTYTIPEPKPVVYTVPSFIVPPVVDLPFPNITIPDITETIGKFVDGLGRLADAFFEDTTKKEPDEMSKKHTIYSRAFKGAYSGLRHLWVNPQDYRDEFVSKGIALSPTGDESIYSEDGEHRIVHWSSSIPSGFIYFSYSDKKPTDNEIEKQSGNLLDIQAGASISVAETLQRFKKARKATESQVYIAPNVAPPSVVDQMMADITAIEDAKVLDSLKNANESLTIVEKAKAALDNAQANLNSVKAINTERKAYVKAENVSSTDVVAALREEMSKYMTEVKSLTAKSDVKPVDQPVDPAFKDVFCDCTVFKNYLQHDRIVGIHETISAKPDTVDAADYDWLLNEALKKARGLSGLADATAEHKSPKEPSQLSIASHSAWNATVAYSSILNAFSTMDVFQSEKGREQLARWSLKWNALYFHLQACALDGQSNLVEDFGRDARNKIRKILDLPPNNLTFAEEEYLMEMKMSDSFKDAPVEAEEVTMSKSIVEDITDTYDKAKWRVAQRQLIRRLRDALILAISQFGHDRSEVKLIEKALKTQLGEGFLALAIGFVGSRVDFLASDPRAAKVLDESKIEGMAAIGDDVIERVATQIAPMVMAALSSSLDALPEIRVEVKDKPKKVRIKSKAKAEEEEDEAIREHEAEEEKTSKRAVAR